MFPFPFSFVAPTASGLADIDNVYSMEFDGIDDYFEVSSFTTSGNDASISFWFKDGGGSGSQYIFAGDANNVIYHVSNTVFYAKIGSGYSNVYIATNTGTVPVNLLDGNWHHIAITKQGVTGVWYLDGTAYAPTGGAFSATGGFTLSRMGAYTNGNAPLNGSLDEVAIFDYTLDADQVQEIYNATSTGKTADLSDMATPPIAWYRMGD
jgi:hypothetical protein